ncbi:uncharacterized protein N7482_000452 [Penicillium canariense]|uniref:Pseudouridine synthase I TruA alpha/beta domain-containing protein n=1 Tax=Penicillium canariense TaxID=189055 RepID=A0A9W9LSN4_9EURO|nr:uncharacterized protein N7482_000452 [Penicillium canariense]KAJ5174575.1 hypothetical protein N7482_000452 [Penicillium canariense]
MTGTSDDGSPDYTTWSNSSLIERITELERQLHSQTTQYTAPASAIGEAVPRAPIATDVSEPAIPLAETDTNPSKKRRAHSPEGDICHAPAPSRPTKEYREFDASKYHTRFIALKFAYLGQRYNGLEHTNGNTTPLPTIEETLWKALRRTRLILPETSSPADEPNDAGPREQRPYSIHWDGCDYSKAGRTDRGVSAFGQVIGLRVRSMRPQPKPKASTENHDLQDGNAMQVEEPAADKDWDDIADEISYIQVLNRVLPEDIRVLAWCPHPPEGFDARFSCRERRYRYFFTQPAFSPTPGAFGFENRTGSGKGERTKYREGWLDIDAMREAAKHFEGTHDFRNFCKLDTSKQIENFERVIFHSDIQLVNPKTNPVGYVGQTGFQITEDFEADVDMFSAEKPNPTIPQVYSFDLYGSAFLWHQVRHMVAILFLVGQGLESPSIVPELLDVAKNPRKPAYDMASDAPLVLWDTIFPDESTGSREDALDWVYVGDPRLNKSRSAKGDSKYGMKGVAESLWAVWRQRKMDEILAGALLDLAVSQGDQSLVQDMEGKQGTSKKQSRGVKIWLGADEARIGGKYVPVMKKAKTEAVEVRNAKWLAAKQRKEANKEAEAKKDET